MVQYCSGCWTRQGPVPIWMYTKLKFPGKCWNLTRYGYFYVVKLGLFTCLVLFLWCVALWLLERNFTKVPIRNSRFKKQIILKVFEWSVDLCKLIVTYLHNFWNLRAEKLLCWYNSWMHHSPHNSCIFLFNTYKHPHEHSNPSEKCVYAVYLILLLAIGSVIFIYCIW